MNVTDVITMNEKKVIMKVIKKKDFLNFVNALIQNKSKTVIGVKSEGSKFVFDVLNSADELRLDYDVTILSPKKCLGRV